VAVRPKLLLDFGQRFHISLYCLTSFLLLLKSSRKRRRCRSTDREELVRRCRSV